jgi:hypothetical protein
VKLAETYKGNGFTPMPCFAWNHPWKSEKQRKSKRKAPGNTKWNGDDWASLTPDELVSLFEPGQNIGIRLDGDLVAIDADTTDPHELDAIRQALPLTSPICEGNRGFKAFVRSKIAPTKSIPLKSGAKIELLGNGHQAIIPPSIHPDTGRPYSVSPSPDGEKRDLGDMRLADVPEVDDVEATLRRELADWIATPSPPLNGARTRGAGEKLTGAKRGKMLDALECIPADPHYDDWLKVLAALHHHGEEEETARAWSATWSEFDPKEFDEKWDSFGNHPTR